jgi:diaminohydroxyphosphoribosylaminopyrimidine deaminase/5-amino-6-(5-phosphoribosylamino)uracil reductase
MSNDQHYIQRCLQLAALGSGQVAPNPLVGSVIVSDGKIIGEGYHRQFGEAHAEVNAIHAVEDKSLLGRATLYVNLEPCSHVGKTPPCTDLIISSGIRKVVIGMQDPFAGVNGSGIRKLREAGIEVICTVLEDECLQLNKRFVCAHTRKRPYLILKWAQSSDGITGNGKERMQISNSLSKIIGHKWRSEESGILIGAGTAAIDDPELNTRYWQGASPVRIILDRSGNLCGKSNLKIFDGQQRTLIYTQQENYNYSNAEVIPISSFTPFLPAVLSHLHQTGIHSLLVEGGSLTHRLFLEQQLWDECRIFISNKIIGQGISAPAIPQGKIHLTTIGDNQLLEIVNQQPA